MRKNGWYASIELSTTGKKNHLNKNFTVGYFKLHYFQNERKKEKNINNYEKIFKFGK